MFKVYNKELTIKGYLFIYVFMMLKSKYNSSYCKAHILI